MLSTVDSFGVPWMCRPFRVALPLIVYQDRLPDVPAVIHSGASRCDHQEFISPPVWVRTVTKGFANG